MPSNCARVIQTVKKWLGHPELAVSRIDVLPDLWLRFGQAGIPFCNDAVNNLIALLKAEFEPAVKVRLQTADFCPIELAPLKSVGDVCDTIDQSEAGQ